MPTCDESANDNCGVTLNTALLACIEMLEAENAKLKLQCEERKYFQIESVADDDNLVHFYTGFVSYRIFQTFFDFLGSSINHLNFSG